ncbi:MAG TPA: hypothetical protein VGO80_18700, partial [Solirubrobacteraceae bacterium]|nr:hypothetical protein [Solirubrobacteraceae bacterium]
SHCQPCRRYALAAGVDVAAVRAPAAVASKVAALLPLPSFLRRRLDPEHVLSVHSSPALNVVAAIDPATVSAWSKAVATAATVAVAGLGAGAAVKHDAVGDLFSRTPSIVGQAPDGSAAERGQARRQALRQTAKLVRGKRSAPEVDMQRAGGGTHESSGTMIGPEAREGTPDAGDSPLASSTESPSSASDPPGSAAGEPAGSPAAEGAIASPGSAGLSDAAKGVLDSESPTVAALTDEPTDGGQTSLQPANTVTNGLHTLVGDATGIAENAIGSDTSPLAKPDLPLPDLGDLSVENVIGETLFDRPLVSRPNDGAPAAPAGEGASADDDRPGPSPGLGGGVGDEPGAGADGRGADAAGGARRGEGADGVGGARRGEGADAAGGVGRGQGAGGAGGATHTHGADAADGTGRSEGAARVLDAIALRDVVVAGKPDSPASADAGVSEAPIGRQAAARALEALMRHDFVGAAAAAGLDLQDIRRDGGVIVAQRPDVAAALQGDPATVRAAGEMIVAVLVARALRDPTAGRS